jgi:hypothetical protein
MRTSPTSITLVPGWCEAGRVRSPLPREPGGPGAHRTERMKAIGAILMVAALTTCGPSDDLIHGDPECAFDATSCLPIDLVLTLRIKDGAPSAILVGRPQIPGENPLRQQPSARVVCWGIEEVRPCLRAAETASPPSEFLQVSPIRTRLSVSGDAERFGAALSRPYTGYVGEKLRGWRELPFEDGTTPLQFDRGRYVLLVHSTWAEGSAAFTFGLAFPPRPSP